MKFALPLVSISMAAMLADETSCGAEHVHVEALMLRPSGFSGARNRRRWVWWHMPEPPVQQTKVVARELYDQITSHLDDRGSMWLDDVENIIDPTSIPPPLADSNGAQVAEPECGIQFEIEGMRGLISDLEKIRMDIWSRDKQEHQSAWARIRWGKVRAELLKQVRAQRQAEYEQFMEWFQNRRDRELSEEDFMAAVDRRATGSNLVSNIREINQTKELFRSGTSPTANRSELTRLAVLLAFWYTANNSAPDSAFWSNWEHKYKELQGHSEYSIWPDWLNKLHDVSCSAAATANLPGSDTLMSKSNLGGTRKSDIGYGKDAPDFRYYKVEASEEQTDCINKTVQTLKELQEIDRAESWGGVELDLPSSVVIWDNLSTAEEACKLVHPVLLLARM